MISVVSENSLAILGKATLGKGILSAYACKHCVRPQTFHLSAQSLGRKTCMTLKRDVPDRKMRSSGPAGLVLLLAMPFVILQ